MRWLAGGIAGLLVALPCAAAAPPLLIPEEPLGVPGAGVPVNLLLNLGVTVQDAGAAYREPYRASRRYAGYFNPQLCYQYPLLARPGSVPVPDLSERGGYFAPVGGADVRHECRGAFSGNFLNWASMSTLDLLRYGLTGGDRVIDQPGVTVVQRAWLPDGAVHEDFYAHPGHFPRKTVPQGGEGSAPTAVTPFAADKLFIASCRNRLLFSNTGDGKSCDGPRFDGAGKRISSDKFYGEFNVRVQVCTPDDARLRPDLCVRYREAYKPQGVLQQASERIGIMGYLTDLQGGGTHEYGGALRAPLKALGGVPAAGAEWHPDTGVLADSPDKKGAVSGAINYINRLGRSNPKRQGAYSRGDPGAELYYEALRYLQRRAASIAPGPDNDDGLPIWRSADDPIQLACQRTIVATVGHAAFSQDRFVPGNVLTREGDGPRQADGTFNAAQATRRMGELEADSGARAAGLLRKLDSHDAAGSYYFAGAAYWAHTNPIRADKPLTVDHAVLELGPASGPLESVLYYAAKYGAFDDRNRDGNPHVTSGGIKDASEWSDGGAPRHYHPAPGADDIIPALRALFGNLGGASIRGPAALGGAGDGAYLIETGYERGSWSGTVQRRALRIGSDGAAGSVEFASSLAWDAGALLTGATSRPPEPLPAARQIYTLLRPAAQPSRTVALRWNTLPPETQAHFDKPGDAAPDGLGAARVDYLRGERALEAGQAGGKGVFRRRTGVLGAIVRSVPLIVGAPSVSVQGAGYAAFLDGARRRRAAVYVGANDGMLHAFDAATGRELFAYAPDALLPMLVQLSSPRQRHFAGVDASPGQGEAQVRGRWISVLASGMGMGARGVFALDVSNPAAFGDGLGALWEFTEHDDPAIGHITEPPRIVKLNAGAKNGAVQQRYFVLVSSGINPASGSGKGVLFLLALDKPPEQPWQSGLNYYKFVTPALDDSSANALSTPAVAIGGDGAARYAWAGDLQGNLWRFDLSGKPPWGGTLAQALFQARDARGAAQPLAHAPAVAFAPGGGYLLLFGTGRFLETVDRGPASFKQQSFYAVHDRLTPIKAAATRSALEPRTLSGSGPYLVKGKPVNYAGEDAKGGWYMDFPDTATDGERAAGSPLLRAGAVLFDTLLPGTDACAAPARRSYLLDALSGSALGPSGSAQEGATTGEMISTDDGPPSVVAAAPLLLEIGTASGPRTATGVALATRRYAVLRPGSGTKGKQLQPGQQVQVSFAARRLSWRQVANWKDIHNKVKP